MCVVAKPVVKNSRYTVTRHLLYESILIHSVSKLYSIKSCLARFFKIRKDPSLKTNDFPSLDFLYDCIMTVSFPSPHTRPPPSLSTPKHNRFSITLIQPFCKVALVTCPLCACFLHSNYLPIRQLLES